MRNSYSVLKSLVAIAVVAFAGTATAAIVSTDQDVYYALPGETFFIDVVVDTEGETLTSWATRSTVNDNVAFISRVREQSGWASDSQVVFPGGEAGVIGINFFGDPANGSDIPLYQLEMVVSGELGEVTELVQEAFPGTWNNPDGDPIDVTFVNPEIRIGVAPIPVPAAVWLFGSGLLGLIGIARRKKATQA